MTRQAEQKQLTEIFENDPNPPASFIPNFLSQSGADDDDEEFTEIDEKEITCVNNDWNSSLERSEDSFIDRLRSFLADLKEETDVLRGNLSEKTLIQRRTNRQKSSFENESLHFF